jgi:hypothetical protein
MFDDEELFEAVEKGQQNRKKKRTPAEKLWDTVDLL